MRWVKDQQRVVVPQTARSAGDLPANRGKNATNHLDHLDHAFPVPWEWPREAATTQSLARYEEVRARPKDPSRELVASWR